MSLSLLVHLDLLISAQSNEGSNNDQEEFKLDSNKVLEYARGDISAEHFIKLLANLEERRQIDRSMVQEFQKLFFHIRALPKPALGS